MVRAERPPACAAGCSEGPLSPPRPGAGYVLCSRPQGLLLPHPSSASSRFHAGRVVGRRTSVGSPFPAEEVSGLGWGWGGRGADHHLAGLAPLWQRQLAYLFGRRAVKKADFTLAWPQRLFPRAPVKHSRETSGQTLVDPHGSTWVNLTHLGELLTQVNVAGVGEWCEQQAGLMETDVWSTLTGI